MPFRSLPSVAKGMQPIRPNHKQALQNSYEVPVDVIENAEELAAWDVVAAQVRGKEAPRRTGLLKGFHSESPLLFGVEPISKLVAERGCMLREMPRS